MGDLLHFPGTIGSVCGRELFEDFCRRQVATKEFIQDPMKRTMEEWSELLIARRDREGESLEAKLRRFRERFIHGV